ncbi:retrovirus-related pol polyprotein from transposon TNT 1-94 [Tanacetum coccineum]
MVTQNQRDLPRDIPLDSIVVLRYEKRSKSENKGKVPTEMELVLEQTQQGTSYEVSVSAEGVEELKRKVKIKGEKKEALLTLRQKPDSILQAGNPVKEILLKLNLPDHRSILTDSKETYKDGLGVKEFLRSFRHSDTERLSRSDEVLKLKNFKKDASLKLLSYQTKKVLVVKRYLIFFMEQLVGVANSLVVDVNNPSVGTPKGRRKLLIKGGNEKEIEKSLKNKNACLLCGSFDHNKRRCPKRFEDQEQVLVQQEVVVQEEVVF